MALWLTMLMPTFGGGCAQDGHRHSRSSRLTSMRYSPMKDTFFGDAEGQVGTDESTERQSFIDVGKKDSDFEKVSGMRTL